MSKNKVSKCINTERIQQIENYDYSLWNLVNPNFRQQSILNPIGAGVALSTLQELRKELDSYEIKLQQIDCNRVFGRNMELTETEVFIRSINSHLNYRNDYNKVMQTKELDKDFPREEREKIANDLEEEIKKEYRKITTVGKINKTLRRASEARVEALGVELRDILSTLEAPTEEYINNMLYLIAESKIKEIKSRLDSKIAYLGSVMEDIA
ncbi:MAG: hypothetical protein KIC66_02450 [Clostridium sp.]|uniref:hypothetical protein n=1 Tax=Clostridium TaxID=1485 RepID=UPI001C1E65EC|nr:MULTISPECIES: hypothetical protein [Clostridium]MBS5925934.1 hypothetical protein [Clostridium sp.]MBU6134548.1 hypothetical protein [Clostridium tertium]